MWVQSYKWYAYAVSKCIENPRGNSFYQIKRCIPMKWRQNIKQPSDVRKETKGSLVFLMNLLYE
ncbi:hypothetical protein ACS0TY_014061 [Phlomoides rotata]